MSEKFKEQVEQNSQKEKSKKIDTQWNAMSSVPSEVFDIFERYPGSKEMVMEAIYAGTYDSHNSTDSAPYIAESDIAYNLESAKYSEHEADVLARWIAKKRREFLDNYEVPYVE